MHKITNKVVVAINTQMLTLMQQYIAAYLTADSTLDSVTMYANDIMYNSTALDDFNNTRNADELYNTLTQQDTLVREHFSSVLSMLEDYVTDDVY